MPAEVKLGLKENAFQFSILVLVNAFVGGMVGLERSILPTLAESSFGIDGKTAILSFIVVFGLVKAASNYYAGALANVLGRKNLLIAGWIAAIPVPILLITANSWNMIILANVFLGINQGLAWSSTVVMKIDLVGQRNRGLAMGLNEFAGYLAVAITAFLTAYIASEFGPRPYPFYLGICLVFLGLVLSVFVVKETKVHASLEGNVSKIPLLKNIFVDTSIRNRNLGSITQAGLVNNLNDGMIWGVFPLLLTSLSFSIEKIGILTAIYPAVWGLGQLGTGKLADIYPKKLLLFIGMLLQGITLLSFAFATSFIQFALLAAVLGLGTALVYPTFLAAIADYTHPKQRANSIGVFRLWRDAGYAVGAVLTGLVADFYSVSTSIIAIALLTMFSAFIILVRMRQSEKEALK